MASFINIQYFNSVYTTYILNYKKYDNLKQYE